MLNDASSRKLTELILEYGSAVIADCGSVRLRRLKRIIACVEAIERAAHEAAIEECAKIAHEMTLYTGYDVAERIRTLLEGS